MNTYPCAIFTNRYPIECVHVAPDYTLWYVLAVTGVTLMVWPWLQALAEWIMYGPVLQLQLCLIVIELAYLSAWYEFEDEVAEE